MKKFSLIAVIALFQYMYSETANSQNLIPNPGFENLKYDLNKISIKFKGHTVPIGFAQNWNSYCRVSFAHKAINDIQKNVHDKYYQGVPCRGGLGCVKMRLHGTEGEDSSELRTHIYARLVTGI